MKKENLLNLADNPDLIPGIYNYCDRWCERCPFTSRCLTYQTLQADEEENPGVKDIHNEAFWKKIHESFALTFPLLQQLAEEHNINLESSAEELEQFSRERKAEREVIEKTTISQWAKCYLDKGKAWLDHSQELLTHKQDELNHALQLNLPHQHPQQEAHEIADAIDVVSYYLFQIYVKMMRAHTGRKEDDQWAEENQFPKDSDGSAKVALIGIDRSIGAWGILLHYLPDQEESILSMLSTLERLRHFIEAGFPQARAFVRPGFDEIK